MCTHPILRFKHRGAYKTNVSHGPPLDWVPAVARWCCRGLLTGTKRWALGLATPQPNRLFNVRKPSIQNRRFLVFSLANSNSCSFRSGAGERGGREGGCLLPVSVPLVLRLKKHSTLALLRLPLLLWLQFKTWRYDETRGALYCVLGMLAADVHRLLLLLLLS